MAPKKIRVLVADDHPVLREGVAALVTAQADMEVVAEADDGSTAVEQARATRPDVAVVDITMPRLGGIEAVRKLREVSPTTRALVLSMHDDPTFVRAALAAGGAGYVTKVALGRRLIDGIREVAAGRSFIDVPLEELPTEVAGAGRTPRADPASRRRLTQREAAVLELVARGYTNTEMGEMLGVSKKSIDTYRARVTDKLGLKNRAELVKFALETGLLAPARRRSKDKR